MISEKEDGVGRDSIYSAVYAEGGCNTDNIMDHTSIDSEGGRKSADTISKAKIDIKIKILHPRSPRRQAAQKGGRMAAQALWPTYLIETARCHRDGL